MTRVLWFRCAVVVAALTILTACGPAAREASEAGPVRVVASFSVLGDMVLNVGGEHIDLSVLAGPGTDSHAYSPTAADAAALAKAQVVLENGLGFDGWLDDLYSAAGSQAVRVQVSAGIETLTSNDQAGEAGDGRDTVDPHIWLNAANAVDMVRNIRDALVTADPAHAAAYRANAATYTTQLQDLDAWIISTVERLPVERRVLVTTHDTFGYFAHRYGFSIVGTVLPTSTEGASPSAQQLAQLVEAVRAAGVPAVFGENVTANGLLSQVAAEAGVEVVASLFTDALGPDGTNATTYLDMMRFNVSTIVNALAS